MRAVLEYQYLPTILRLLDTMVSADAEAGKILNPHEYYIAIKTLFFSWQSADITVLLPEIQRHAADLAAQHGKAVSHAG